MDNKSPDSKILNGCMIDISCPYCGEVRSDGYFANPKVVKCLACGLFRFFPRISSEGVQIAMEIGKKKFSLTSPIVAAKNSSSRDRAVLKMLKRQIPHFLMGPKALDIGCFTGGFVEFLNRIGFKASGLDPFSSAVEYGRRFDLDLNVGFFDEKSISNKFSNESFSLISFMNSFYYNQDIKKALCLTRQLLKKDGCLLIQSFSIYSPFFWFNKKAIFSRLGYHASFLPSFETLEGVLKREGFFISESFRLHFPVSKTLFPMSKLLPLNIPGIFANSRALSLGGRILNRMICLPFQAFGRQDQILILARLQ